MTRSLPGRLRRLWFNMHLWIGVGLSLLLIPLGLTGSALVWGDVWLRHDPGRAISGPPAPARAPSAYLAAAQTGLAGTATATMLRWPQHAGDAVEVDARPSGGPPPAPGERPRTVAVFLNPADARVLSEGPGRPGWWMTLHGFHENLLQRGWGRPVVGWLGVAMLISSLTGVWLWWPRAGALLKGLRFRRTPGLWLNLHHTAGFWISLPLAFASLTGIALGFPQTTRAVIGSFAPVSPPRGEPSPGGAVGGDPHRSGPRHGHLLGGARHPWVPALSADAAIFRAGASGFRTLTLPGRDHPFWRVELADGRAVQVDDATGAATPASPQPSGDLMIRWLHRLHGGTDLPLLWRLILTLAGLAPLLLGVTGVTVWASRTLRRRRLAEPG